MNRIFLFGLHHRTLLLLVISLFTVVAIVGMQRLQVDAGVGSMITKDNPDYAIYKQVVDVFGSDQQTLVFVRDEGLWSVEKLTVLRALHDRLLALDAVQSVQDIFTVRMLRGEQASISSKLLLDHLPDNQADIDRIKQDVLHHPLIQGRLVSSDGQALALMLRLKPEVIQAMGNATVFAALENVLADYKPSFDRLFQMGSSRIQVEMEQTLFSDMRMLGPLSAGVLLLVILLMMRSVVAGFIPLITASLSLIWTLGMLGWAGIPVNILSAMLPTLIIVIGSTEDTHLIASFLALRRGDPNKEPQLCVQQMMRKMALPLLLTIFTTVLGFAANLFSSMVLIRDFALASSFAMLANGAITLFLVPVLLTILGKRTLRSTPTDRESWLSGLVLQLNQQKNIWVQRLILLGTMVLCIFFVYEASKLYVSNDPMSYFKQDHALIQDADEVDAHLSGMKTFYVYLQSDRSEVFLQPKFLKKLEKIQVFMRKQGGFDSSLSLADYLKLLNREFHAGDERWYKLPEHKDMVAQLLLFMHRQELKPYVSFDAARAVIIVRHHLSDSNVLNRNVAELRLVAQEIAGQDLHVSVVGENIMINEQADALLHAQVDSLLIFLAIVFLLMSAMYTSFKGGLIAMVPSIIPVVLMFGVMGLCGIPLNPGTAMVAVIAIGVAIDSTIHMLSCYNVHSRKMGDAAQATRQTVREEALPMITTSVALALGFGVLLASDFAIIGQFGALSAATMLFALFANLVVTPLIMSRVRLVGLSDILALSVDKEALRHCQLFHGMTNYQIRKAMLITEMIEFDQGVHIIEQGHMDRCMYLLIKGEVEVVHHGDDGDKVLAQLQSGEVFGEIAFVHKMRRTATVRALNPVSVVKFDCERLKHDLRYFPRIVAKLNYNLSYILGERLASTLKQL